jgi:general secretion pathway protein K
MRAGKKRVGVPEREVETGCPKNRGAALKAEPDNMNFGSGSDVKAPRPRGFIVVAVLWILAALSALVLIYLTYVTNTAVVVAGSADRVQTEALVTAGVELAAYQLTAVNPDFRPTAGAFDARVGAGSVTVTFRSEAARIDLNAAPKGLLAGLMTGLGAAPSDAAGYADRILAWRAPTELGDADPENSFYRASGASYIPRHAPFPQAEELWLVKGIPPQLIERMLPFVTVFSNLAAINILDAAPQVVAALPGMTPENLQAVLVQRGDPTLDPRSLPGLTGNAEAATLAGSKAYRITVAVKPGSGRPSTAEVVILLLESGDEPYRILSWRHAADGGAGPQRTSLR